MTLAGSGTYTTAIGDRVGGRTLQNGGAGRLNFVVALTGAGTQTFAGTAPTYTGTTTVNSGTLRLWNTSAWASNVDPERRHAQSAPDGDRNSRVRGRQRRDAHAFAEPSAARAVRCARPATARSS